MKIRSGNRSAAMKSKREEALERVKNSETKRGRSKNVKWETETKHETKRERERLMLN